MIEHIKYLSPISLELSWIYLDPNNPRFIEELTDIIEEDVTSETAQERSKAILEKKYGLKNLQDSILSNGFLPIDRIIVQKIRNSESAYIVLEGNRRVAAAKNAYDLISKGSVEVADYIRDSLNTIPALLYTGMDTKAAWIFQGLRHISGIKDWSAVHKAKLLVEQMTEHKLNYTAVGRIFGISQYSAAQWARAYYAYKQISEIDDFKNDVDYKCFPYLQELFGRSDIALQNWLKWDDTDKRFTSEDNLLEYLGWLYPKFDENGEVDNERAGDWEHRRIPTAQDQRLISKSITDHKELFSSFRQGQSINVVRLKIAQEEESTKQTVANYIRQLDDINAEFVDLPVLKLKNENKDTELSKKIEELISTLNKLNKFFQNAE